MKKSNLKKFAGFSPRYRIALFIGTVVVGAVVAIAYGGVLGREGKLSVESASPRLVRSFTVMSIQGSAAEYTGVIHARTESHLGFRVPGKIIEKLVKDGDHVKRGQALMRLDPTDLKLAAAVAREAVEAARAQNNLALADGRRLRKLVAMEAASVQEYDRAKSSADATTAQLKAAVAHSAQLENQVDYAVLKAEADGVIMETPADVGQVVGAGTVVIRLAHDGAREAVVNLPEGEAKVAKKFRAVAKLYADQDQTFPAQLRELSAMADPLTRTYQARYTLSGAGENAPLGATVTVHLDGKETDGAVKLYEIPIGALYDGGTGTSVWVVKKNPDTSIVSRQSVEVAKLGSETALISKGLKPGERILALGAHLVTEGEQVKIIADPAQEQKL
ncbi:MAG: efflux RND transporter periplasmic adaptor subunit [Desulforhopalus sp.]|nr:efflux RND transporter periplasmic adaptor subunit [Desulforhopalus sp.]